MPQPRDPTDGNQETSCSAPRTIGASPFVSLARVVTVAGLASARLSSGDRVSALMTAPLFRGAKRRERDGARPLSASLC
jgi:hypothetical protein